jgi:hypothetical protein
MNESQINSMIVKLEAELLVGAPAFETREEYQIQQAWLQERTNASRAFKAALVKNNQEEAYAILGQIKAAFGITVKFS